MCIFFILAQFTFYMEVRILTKRRRAPSCVKVIYLPFAINIQHQNRSGLFLVCVLSP